MKTIAVHCKPPEGSTYGRVQRNKWTKKSAV